MMPATENPNHVCPQSESDSSDDSDEDASHYKDGEDGHSKMRPMTKKDGDNSKECTGGAFHGINWDNMHIANCTKRE